ncbi:YkoV protein [Fimbriimonas ginsengisoli Gsoil 348]|uniref:Non-homologous end joining protein Ku n=1 Tax=Fimbriimonas ginsengisoli Gsoil 348 TaxID=661478 RepID=A0A068NQI2_FIMGI|nr:YkoV protein [Fimbriimonas ginsengisoli Gsoil 348]
MSFGMVSIPVALYPAVQEHDIRFHQIHKKCGSRIKQQKWCPVDEEVVSADEIARGYEISKGRYVLIDDEDLEALPVPTKHTITVGSFVDAGQIDPIYFDQPYYVEPEETGKKPYALLLKALESKGMAAVAKIAMRQKESLTLLRAAEGRLVLETLHYPDEIREMAHVGGNIQVDERELKMAESLVDLLTEPFEPGKYKDDYREALMARIEAKSHGENIREQPEAPQAQVIDLFEALKRSLETAKGQTAKPAEKRRKAS